MLALTLSVVTIFALGYGVLQTQAYAEDAAGDTFVLTGQGADGASDVTPADAGAAASNQDAAQTDPIPGNSAEQDTGAAASDSLSQQEFTASVYSDDTLTTLTTEHTIHVSGELPAGGYAVAYPVDPSTVDGDVLCAYDITAYCADGTKFEPDADNPLTVSIDMPDLPDGLEADDLGLVYVPADPAQAPESLPTPVAVTDTGVSFEVEHFSTYVVTVVSVSQWSIYLDSGLIAYQRAATPAGTNGTYTGSVTSTYPGQAHSFDLSSTNQNLYFTSVTKDGVEQ
ncbi:MAG: hypothetical protein FWF33_02755, partial [Clostridiales bacterium]|nr:hypothetical protein [Clostridiales bacterium]